MQFVTNSYPPEKLLTMRIHRLVSIDNATTELEMKKSTKVLIATAMALGISGGVYAFGKYNHWGFSAEDRMEFVIERVSKKLELNDIQQQNLQTLAKEVLALMKEMRDERSAHLAQIESMLKEPVLDQAKALNMIETKTASISNKAPAVIASLAVFLDSLTIEQKSRIHEFIERDAHHYHEH